LPVFRKWQAADKYRQAMGLKAINHCSGTFKTPEIRLGAGVRLNFLNYHEFIPLTSANILLRQFPFDRSKQLRRLRISPAIAAPDLKRLTQNLAGVILICLLRHSGP
jgi:hypothetical protein